MSSEINNAIPTKITPRALARRYRVSPDKILAWIRSGELRAVNIATKPGGRPRYAIDEADVAAFEERRTAVQPNKTGRRLKGGKGDQQVIRFY
jgi:hypothetical protein